MKAPQRSALLAGGFAAAVMLSAVPSVAGAQRQQQPGPDTKNVLVTTFRGDPESGVKVADEIRDRIQGEYSIRTLMPVSKKNIDNTLVSSGYRPDSALSSNDLKELSKLVRADEIIDGTVTKGGSGLHVCTWLFLPRDVSLKQPLGCVDARDPGGVAKQVVDEYDRARKQLPDNQACENGIRANNTATATAAARKGITTYGKATIARLCLASAYAAAADSTGPSRDSVISITKDIINLDPTNRIAYELLYNKLKDKGDGEGSLKALIGLLGADPTNTALIERVIAEIVNSGRAKLAVPYALQLNNSNPGDPQYARLYWQVLRASKDYKASVPAGIAYVSLDSTQADSGYFDRQIADLVADSSYAKAAEMASMASAKYPKRTDYLLIKAQNEQKAGQLQAAKATLERVLQIDPKTPLVNVRLATIANDLGSPEDALKYLKADVAADPSVKERDAAFATSYGRKLYDAAAASKKVEDYHRALTALQGAEELNPNVQAEFFMAVSAFQIIATTAPELQKSHSCEEFKQANDLLSVVSVNMIKGNPVSKETAGQIMGSLPQFQAFIDASLKNNKCK